MNPVRRAISLALAVLLFIAGTGSLIYLLEFADHFRGWSVMAGALMVDMPQKYRGLRLGVRPLLGVKQTSIEYAFGD